MSRRFLASIVFIDLSVLIGAIAVGSLSILANPLPWESTQIRGPVGATLVVLVGGAVISEYIALKVLTTTVPRPSYARAFLVATATYMLLAVFITVARPWYSLGFLAVTGAVWLGVMLTHRFVLRLSPWSESMVIISANQSAVDEINQSPHASIRNVLDPQSGHVPDPLGDGTGLIVDFGVSFSDKVGRFITSSLLTGTNVRALTAVYEEHTGKLPLAHLADGWEIPQLVRRNRTYGPFKRILDLIFAIGAAPVSLFLGLIAAVAVKVSSPGPVVYRQPRVGRGGKTFTLYKLRTMYNDSEVAGPQFATLDDPRITRVGHWLRKLRLDELPQLWNVLRGDLSLVGPRPEQEKFVADFVRDIPFYGDRHLVRPGITGWAQVNSGYAENVEETIEKLKYDLFYIKHMSVWMDLRILLRSVATVVTGSGSR
jgi:lipopolysaccharide/colanic/teichoic acid biosynthesis glycosyltransferase